MVEPKFSGFNSCRLLRQRGFRVPKVLKVGRLRKLGVCLLLIVLVFITCIVEEYRQSLPSYNSARALKKPSECFAEGSQWHNILNGSLEKLSDGAYLGGATPKVVARFSGPQHPKRAVWKPFLFVNPNANRRHVEQALYEVFAFHVGCMVGMELTPPAVGWSFNSRTLLDTIGGVTAGQLAYRRLDIAREPSFALPGVMLSFYENLQHRSEIGRKVAPWLENITLRWLPNVERELSSQQVQDHLTGNWDRTNNYFWIRSAAGVKLVNADNNHLTFNPRNALTHCRFHRPLVERLRELDRFDRAWDGGNIIISPRPVPPDFERNRRNASYHAGHQACTVCFENQRSERYGCITKGEGEDEELPAAGLTLQTAVSLVRRDPLFCSYLRMEIDTGQSSEEGFNVNSRAPDTFRRGWSLLKALDGRVRQVLTHVDKCVAKFDEDHVFN
uniref:Uncharacterized protein n=1 Tax=Pyramimonas obovata TaxID=1411642 RepID=A0A7S0RZ55_9CHLO|mmetsp:Transcript_8757/g.18151  ORF Transcript_8757/g.18151 Transcript_8757/m.18151 type:complete len:444 (+) Transcript_8757:142-1473(+)|eukprot:CAMPEP_0118937352 /NCGR_PEP_ID=MMETSP1169-20130426/22430_1 /TAXON_ID=36882 /ORGANISM="Pyramimonas obovata, Strain CCMP722" /LENGTH=443 /DNA_ID=CAMNT_0006880947 /DNA_START=73 /DNA_END=1404 /DNA_ORIENTATION=-